MQEFLLKSETIALSNVLGLHGWPTPSQLQQWLREYHKIYVAVLPFQELEDGHGIDFYYSLVNYNDPDYSEHNVLCNEIDLGASNTTYESYEEAMEEGLLAALLIIKRNEI